MAKQGPADTGRQMAEDARLRAEEKDAEEKDTEGEESGEDEDEDEDEEADSTEKSVIGAVRPSEEMTVVEGEELFKAIADAHEEFAETLIAALPEMIAGALEVALTGDKGAAVLSKALDTDASRKVLRSVLGGRLKESTGSLTKAIADAREAADELTKAISGGQELTKAISERAVASAALADEAARTVAAPKATAVVGEEVLEKGNVYAEPVGETDASLVGRAQELQKAIGRPIPGLGDAILEIQNGGTLTHPTGRTLRAALDAAKK